jgi:molybdopterin-biosynthesis enzyme MoeA-like protein
VGAFVSRQANYMVAGVSEAMIAPALIRIVNGNPPEKMYLKTHPQGYRKTTPRIRVQLVCKGADRKEVEKRLSKVSGQILRAVEKLGGRVE